MSTRIVIVGYGAVGRALASLLASRGDDVAIARRHRPSAAPAKYCFRAANVELDGRLSKVRPPASRTGRPDPSIWWAKAPVGMGPGLRVLPL
jgi:hypothetical protein